MKSTNELTERRILARILEEEEEADKYTEKDFLVRDHKILFRKLVVLGKGRVSFQDLFFNLLLEDRYRIITLAIEISNDFIKKKLAMKTPA